MKIAIMILSTISMGLAGSSYYLYDSNKKTQTENEVLQDLREELMFKVNNLEKEKNTIANELETKITEISKEKEEEITRLKGTYDELVTDMKKEIE